MSKVELGKEPPPGLPPEVLEQWDGVSVYTTRDGARANYRRHPWLGRFVAELRIPDGAPVAHDEPTPSGHFNLRAPGTVIFQYLADVRAVDE